ETRPYPLAAIRYRLRYVDGVSEAADDRGGAAVSDGHQADPHLSARRAPGRVAGIPRRRGARPAATLARARPARGGAARRPRWSAGLRHALRRAAREWRAAGGDHQVGAAAGRRGVDRPTVDHPARRAFRLLYWAIHGRS